MGFPDVSGARALVTGAAGFLGGAIARELQARGFQLSLFDCVASPEGIGDRFIGDIRDADALRVAMAGCDIVYHCAAVAELEDASKDPRLAIDVNVLGTLSVLESARDAGVSRFMHASSVYVLSRSGSIYRTSKQAAENLVADFTTLYQLPSTVLRFGSLYGPGANDRNAIRRIVTQAVNEGRVDFWGNGSEVREYIHIGDAASLAVDALDERFVGQTLHISGRERVSTAEVLEMLSEMLGGDVAIALNDEPFEGRYRLTPYAYDSTAARRLTSDTYVDLGLGLMDVIQEVSAESDPDRR